MNAHSGWDIDAKVEELLASPAGCTFLVVLQESGAGAADAVRPEISLQAAYVAIDELSIWRADFPEIMKYALMHGQRLRGLARAVIDQPDIDWWFAPVDREAQIWASSRRDTPTPAGFDPPNTQMTNWERSVNKSENALYTCTSFDGKSSFLTAMDISDVHGPNDLTMEFEFPVKQWRLRVDDAARVYEVNSAWDWHGLCANYPARSARDASDPVPSDRAGWGAYPLRLAPQSDVGHNTRTDIDRWLTPDWAAVAEDWDGVHLTLGGLLTAEKVRVVSAAGWSMLRFWDMEQTMWLRWAFDKVERLQDYDAIPLPIEAEFPYADYWKFRDTLGKDYGRAIATYTIDPS